MDHNSVGFWAGISALVAAILGGIMALLRLVNKPIELHLSSITKQLDKGAERMEKMDSKLDENTINIAKLSQRVTDHVAWEERGRPLPRDTTD